MTNKRMLIDATHPEETRVVVISGNRLEDFDVEVESRKQLKGNIYLAKVTRVEPSLQAAFIDYGGNRHGFLAFNEIHPDYFRIPVADLREDEGDDDVAESADQEPASEDERPAEDDGEREVGGVETIGGDDSEEVEAHRPRSVPPRYKIQEVIKRRHILLVQVVKEERGNKGAALTTFVSLAGRYCVLMPNTARGGGISRKIANGPDRKKLRTILASLEIPKGMAVIVRTAGAKRSKAEINRDYDYLLRLWDSVRELTLESSAPTLVHEEGNLIKRSIRDIYNSDISEIIVAGDSAYRTAKDFMKLLIPSHAKRVQPYNNPSMPLIRSFKIEDQLDAMHNPNVQLKSGGYVVINPTEALVAIDVNSGRATRERNIEETALMTNLEAADEVARQLRLRDLAGLIVIDFIDMEVSRNNAQVERRLKESMRHDRARIQLGKISPFGLLELSRQRLRPSLIETSSEPCPYCAGSGVRRSTESSALFVLRAIEEESTRRRTGRIVVHLPTEIAMYILNHKRLNLADIESRSNLSVLLVGDDTLTPPNHRIERVKEQDIKAPRPQEDRQEEAPAQAAAQAAAPAADEEEEGGKRRRRSRRRRKPTGEKRGAAPEAAEAPRDEEPRAEAESAEPAEPDDKAREEAETTEDKAPDASTKRRRRGRRGGRRRSRKPAEQPTDGAVESPAAPSDVILLGGPAESPLIEVPPEVVLVTPPPPSATAIEEAPAAAAGPAAGASSDAAAVANPETEARFDSADKPAAGKTPARRRRAKAAGGKGTPAEEAATNVVIDIGSSESQATKPPRRKGWWQR